MVQQIFAVIFPDAPKTGTEAIATKATGLAATFAEYRAGFSAWMGRIIIGATPADTLAHLCLYAYSYLQQ